MLQLRPLLIPLLVGIVTLFGSGAGCSNLMGVDDNREVEHVVAEVDSIDVPAQIASSDALSIRLHGTVGPNGCYSFDRFDVDRSTDRLAVKPVVEHVTRDDVACTMAVVPLDKTYTADPPFEEGTLTVVIPQPDRADVTATVEVQ